LWRTSPCENLGMGTMRERRRSAIHGQFNRSKYMSEQADG
jgi:hypothetical protein